MGSATGRGVRQFLAGGEWFLGTQEGGDKSNLSGGSGGDNRLKKDLLLGTKSTFFLAACGGQSLGRGTVVRMPFVWGGSLFGRPGGVSPLPPPWPPLALLDALHVHAFAPAASVNRERGRRGEKDTFFFKNDDFVGITSCAYYGPGGQ